MDQRNILKFAALFITLLGCGDDDEGGGKESMTGSVKASCSQICDRMEAAKCGVDLARCEQLCEQQYAMTPASCLRSADQLLECASKATFSCGADGPVATFCAPLEATLDACSAGGVATDAGLLPAQDAGSSATASDARVATPAVDAGLGASPSDAAPPAPSMADAGMVDTGVADASAPRADAGNDAGVIPLSCAPAEDDESCDLCLKSSCCSEFSACGVGSDCLALIECVDECETASCYDSCEAQHVQGSAMFDRILSCSSARCSAVCEDEDPMSGLSARPPPADKCLPTFAPAGICTDPSKPVGYDCKAQPFSDCVAVPNISDVYCCGLG